jgi:hypothetical protein
VIDRLDRTVGRELRRLGPAGDAPGMAEIVRAWPTAVGETVVRHAWPARLARDGTLHVTASSSTWAFELGRLAADILERLRAELGEGAPAALRFTAGALPEPAADAAALAPKPVRPAPEEIELGAALAAGIGDEELRALVARAAAASLARGRERRSSGRGF